MTYATGALSTRGPQIFLPIAAVVGSIISLSIGTAFAERLFPIIGPEGTTSLRVGFAALMLLGVWKPWRRRLAFDTFVTVAMYGLMLGAMNLLFYKSLRTIPFGIAVAIEFAGPLLLATASSRRAIDFLWIALAILGLACLLPIGGASVTLDPVGLAYAGAAGITWALYILLGQRAGQKRGDDAVALGSTVGALVVLPFGVAEAGMSLLSPAVLFAGMLVGLLSSAIPYSLDLYALQRMPRQTFSILVSLEPAVSALAGLIVLGQALSNGQWIAISSIVVASIGSVYTASRS